MCAAGGGGGGGGPGKEARGGFTSKSHLGPWMRKDLLLLGCHESRLLHTHTHTHTYTHTLSLYRSPLPAFPNQKVLCFAHSSWEDGCSSKLLEEFLRTRLVERDCGTIYTAAAWNIQARKNYLNTN